MMLIKMQLETSAQRAALTDAINLAGIKSSVLDDHDKDTILQALKEFHDSLKNKLYHANVRPDSLIQEYLNRRIRTTASLIQLLQ